MSHCLRKEGVRRELEGSLKRLKVETVDLYQLTGLHRKKISRKAGPARLTLSGKGKPATSACLISTLRILKGLNTSISLPLSSRLIALYEEA